MVEAKLAENQEGEENKTALAEHKQKWAEISVKYK